MDWSAAKDVLLEWGLPLILGYASKQIRSLAKTFRKMNDSVTDLKGSVISLNEKMGTIVDHINNHEDRLVHLETKKKVKREPTSNHIS